MWEIDSKLVAGSLITEEEKAFYNSNWSKMVGEMRENYEHWIYHTAKIK